MVPFLYQPQGILIIISINAGDGSWWLAAVPEAFFCHFTQTPPGNQEEEYKRGSQTPKPLNLSNFLRSKILKLKQYFPVYNISCKT